MYHQSRHGSWRRVARALSPIAQSAIVLLLVLTMLSGCADKSGGPSKPGGGSGNETFGIQVVNASGVTVTVRINGPQFAQKSVTVASFGHLPVEVDASTGDAITFEADGGGYPTASGGCSAGADAVDGYPDIYAQINILPPLAPGEPLQIICSSGWQ